MAYRWLMVTLKCGRFIDTKFSTKKKDDEKLVAFIERAFSFYPDLEKVKAALHVLSSVKMDFRLNLLKRKIILNVNYRS